MVGDSNFFSWSTEKDDFKDYQNLPDVGHTNRSGHVTGRRPMLRNKVTHMVRALDAISLQEQAFVFLHRSR
jgi:hypothetical protein